MPISISVKKLLGFFDRQATIGGRHALGLVRAANAARDRREYREAAALYREALRRRPGWIGTRIQAGHMFKETGAHEEAERHYLHALAASPDDADLALQLGHFYKTVGRFADALAQYRRATVLAPGWAVPADELKQLAMRGGGAIDSDGVADEAGFAAGLVPEILPGPPNDARLVFDSIEIRRLAARRDRSPWGLLPMLSGVESLRGVCVSRETLPEVEVLLDGEPFLRRPLLAFPTSVPGATKYVFNLWYDVSAVPAGLHRIEVRIADLGGAVRRYVEHVLIVPPLAPADHPHSDGLVAMDPADPRSVEEQIRALPSVIHRVEDRFEKPPERILVLRTDQLGDLVVSLPAMRRLRAAFPRAQIVGLVTAANADLARICGLFDDVVIADFPDILEQRRRTMAPEKQASLRRTLARYRFDIAIDLALSSMSRPVLLLSGAKRLYGFGDADWPWLSAGVEGRTHDPKNDNEDSPQSSRIVSLIDRIVTLHGNDARIERRDDVHRDDLASIGLPTNARYAVLHAGARIVFSRWHGYPALVQRLLDDTDLHIVVIAEDSDTLAAVRAAGDGSPRLTLIDRHLPFDRFDALLQFATVFVGNDSGPKHLAALRGAPVVSLHSARINWREWGQEQTGVVVSRRVPCAGCTLYHDVEECGQDYSCVTDISVDEVYAAIEMVLG